MAREWTEEQKQQARERELARRSLGSTATVDTEPEPTASVLPPEVLALIKDLTDKVGALEAKLVEKDRQTPRMVPMGSADLPNPGQVAANLNRGEGRDGGAQLPVGSRGLRLDDAVFNMFDQRFEPGQRVRINPDSHRDGWADGMTWAKILDQVGTFNCGTKRGRGTCKTPVRVNEVCPRCGAAPIVKNVRYLAKNGEWKYIVKVPGITARQGLGDGFHQSELLPA